MAFNAMVHTIRHDLVDLTTLRDVSNRDRLRKAFDLADKELGIPQLLDPEG